MRRALIEIGRVVAAPAVSCEGKQQALDLVSQIVAEALDLERRGAGLEGLEPGDVCGDFDPSMQALKATPRTA